MMPLFAPPPPSVAAPPPSPVTGGWRARGWGLLGAGLLAAGCERAPAPPPRAVLVPLTNMVPIRAGTFQRVRFPVTLTRDYWLGRYEVTQGEFLAVLGRNPSHFTNGHDLRRPVEKVSFLEASNYCAALTVRERAAGRLPAGLVYRLPTEAEWEHACRAGEAGRFSFGDEPGPGDAYAWTAENSDAQTHPVGRKQPNAWGLHDLHGNVWEWCADWFAPYPPAAQTDPAGAPAGVYKVFKGGGWNQELEFARTVNRFMMSPANGINFVGFRVALGPVIPAPATNP